MNYKFVIDNDSNSKIINGSFLDDDGFVPKFLMTGSFLKLEFLDNRFVLFCMKRN